MKRFRVRSRVPRHGEGLARKGAGTIRLWTVSFRKLGTIRSDGQNTRLKLCLVVQRSVRESDSEHGAKELSRWSVLGTNSIHPLMRSPVSAQNQNHGNRSSLVVENKVLRFEVWFWKERCPGPSKSSVKRWVRLMATTGKSDSFDMPSGRHLSKATTCGRFQRNSKHTNSSGKRM